MDSIKLESNIKLETIFISLNKNNLQKLDDLLSLKEIDLLEKSLINKFIYITNQTESTPSIETLKKEFPSLYFDDVERIKESELNDYIRLYISNKKNIFIAKQLLEMSNLVRTNGLDEGIINKLNLLTKSDVVSIEHDDITSKIIEIYKNKPTDSGISTGVSRIDKDTGGLHPGTLTTILGFTGAFKTTWALDISYKARIQEKNTCYLSLEVTKEKVMYDFLSRQSFDNKYSVHLDNKKLKSKTLNDKELDYLEKKIYPDFLKAKGKAYVIDETELESYSFYSLENKFREIDKLAIEETGHGIDLLVIDHAQLLKFDVSMKGIGNETNIVNAYVSFFRQQALNWIKSGRQVAVLMLSQSSRTGWQEAVKGEGRYRLTALAEANELERASSIVLSTYTSEALKQTKSAKVQILKNRDGESWADPMETFVDPVYCVFGDSSGNQAETSNSFDISNIDSLFDSSDDMSEIATLSEEAALSNIDLEL